MNSIGTFIWICPVLEQLDLEQWLRSINEKLSEVGCQPVSQLSQLKINFLKDPKEALRIEIPLTSREWVEEPIARNTLALQLRESLREAIWSEVLAHALVGSPPYALSIQTLETRTAQKKLICFDMDSTLINEEVIDEIARMAGFYPQVSEITEQAMQGRLDFRASLRERVKLFAGMPKAQVAHILTQLSLSPGAESLIQFARAQRLCTTVVSGGFEIILRHFQKQLFLDHVYGNILETDDFERLTGEVEEPIVDAEYKRKLVAQIKSQMGWSTAETITVGDGANDIPMMSESGISVSFCGKPKLAAHVNTLILERNLYWVRHVL